MEIFFVEGMLAFLGSQWSDADHEDWCSWVKMEHKQFVPIMCFDGLLTVAPPYSKAKLRPTMAKEKFIEAVPAPSP